MKRRFHGTSAQLRAYRELNLLNLTPAEKWAEKILKQRFQKEQIDVQFVYGFRRFDFFFPYIKTAVEIDGGYHFTKEKFIDDKVKDNYLFRRRGIKVFRVQNFDNTKMNEVCDKMREEFNRKRGLPTQDKSCRKIMLDNHKNKKEEINKVIEMKKLMQPKVILRKKSE